jgi:DNA end-binding protein Ku
VLDDEDFANLPISSSRAVEVLSFVPAEQVDAVQFVKAYFCDPTGDVKPYVLLRDSLEQSNKVAIVKVALRQRERLAMLRTRDGVLVLQTLLWPDEVRDARFDFLDQDVTVRPQELAMAESYISALSADFEPGEYSDHYREALESVISDKAAGREVKAPTEAAPTSGQVVDLMEALRRSVAEAKSKRGEATGGEAVTAKATAEKPAKKTTTKKAAKTTATAKKAAKSTKAAKKTTEKKAATRRSA